MCPGSVPNSIGAASDATISFSWSYHTNDVDGPTFDPFFYLNGGLTQLTNSGGPNSQSGSFSALVSAGDIFGFNQHSLDSIFGSATTTISNFNVTPVPEPETYAMLLAGLSLLGFAARRRKLQPAA